MFMSISRKFLFLHDIQLSIFSWNLIHWDSEKLYLLILLVYSKKPPFSTPFISTIILKRRALILSTSHPLLYNTLLPALFPFFFPSGKMPFPSRAYPSIPLSPSNFANSSIAFSPPYVKLMTRTLYKWCLLLFFSWLIPTSKIFPLYSLSADTYSFFLI